MVLLHVVAGSVFLSTFVDLNFIFAEATDIEMSRYVEAVGKSSFCVTLMRRRQEDVESTALTKLQSLENALAFSCQP